MGLHSKTSPKTIVVISIREGNMTNLVRIDSQGNIQKLESADFANEVDELQSYIRKNPTILGDKISIIAEQLDTGSGKKLDMLALEEVREGVVRPVVVELKIVEADTDALLQVLRYANWVLSNIDSVRLYKEKSRAKSKEMDNSSVKVLVVAPAVKDELLELSNYIVESIDFGFLEFGRFRDTTGDILSLDWKTPAVPSGTMTYVQQEWNWIKYETELKIGSERIKIGKHLYDGLEKLNSEKEWGLTPVFRKYYIAFKKSGYNVAEIDLYTRATYLTVRLPKSPKELGLRDIHLELDQSHSKEYSRYSFKIVDTDLEVADFSDYIEKAIELL